MKPSYFQTSVLACALIAAFLFGYVLRDSQNPEHGRASADLVSANLLRTARPLTTVDVDPIPIESDDDSEVERRGRNGAGIPMPFGTSQLIIETRRTSDNSESSGQGLAPFVQSSFGMVPVRPVSLPTFFVPVSAGRSKDDEKDLTEGRPPSYVIFGPEKDDVLFESLSGWLVGDEKEVKVEHAASIKEVVASEADVVVFLIGRKSAPEMSATEIANLEKRKKIGIGLGAVDTFEDTRSRINRSRLNREIPNARVAEFTVPQNTFIEASEEPIGIFESAPTTREWAFRSIFAYVRKNSSNREEPEVIAVLTSDPSHSLVVRDGNSIIIGVNNRVEYWSPRFGTFVRQLARALATRE